MDRLSQVYCFQYTLPDPGIRWEQDEQCLHTNKGRKQTKKFHSDDLSKNQDQRTGGAAQLFWLCVVLRFDWRIVYNRLHKGQFVVTLYTYHADAGADQCFSSLRLGLSCASRARISVWPKADLRRSNVRMTHFCLRPTWQEPVRELRVVPRLTPWNSVSGVAFAPL